MINFTKYYPVGTIRWCGDDMLAKIVASWEESFILHQQPPNIMNTLLITNVMNTTCNFVLLL